MNKAALGYVRVSTDDQASNGISLRAQAEQIEAYCAREGLELLAVFFDSESAGTEDRPGYSSLLSHLEPGQALVAWRLDRLWRNTADAMIRAAELARIGISIRSVTQTLETETPDGEFNFGLQALLDTRERKLIGFRTKMALASLRNRGLAYGPTPIGFRRKGDKLEPDPFFTETSRIIFRRKGEGVGFLRIADELNRLRRPVANNPKRRKGVDKTGLVARWHASTVRLAWLKTKEAMA